MCEREREGGGGLREFLTAEGDLGFLILLSFLASSAELDEKGNRGR